MFLANVLGLDGVIVLVVIVVVLLFGGTQLPKLARGFGEASHQFKRGQKEGVEAGKSDAAKPEIANPADDNITMTKADLDALPAERDAKAKRESETPPSE
jgi:sec-independent protein translocase protein TatA